MRHRHSTPIADLTGIDAVSEGDVVSIPINGGDVDSGDTLTLSITGLPPEVLADDGDGTGSIDWTTDLDDSGTYPVTVAITDGINPPVEQSFTIDVLQTDAGTVLYRVNPNGPAIGDWEADTGTPSYLVQGGAEIFATGDTIGTGHPTVPAGTPVALFQTERYDAASPPEMEWEFPVAEGAEVEVRVYLAEIFSTSANARVFDIALDGAVLPDFDDVDVWAQVGHDQGLVLDAVITAGADGKVDIDFLHDVIQNPTVKAIEIRLLDDNGVVSGALGAPASVDLGQVLATSATSQQTVTLTNDGVAGSAPITVSGVSITGADSTEFTDDFAGPVEVAAGDSYDIVVTFDPATPGLKSADLVVTHDGTNSPTVTVGLTGEGLAADITNPITVETWVVGDALFRVNAGGPLIADPDGGVVWTADPAAGGNPYLNAAYDDAGRRPAQGGHHRDGDHAERIGACRCTGGDVPVGTVGSVQRARDGVQLPRGERNPGRGAPVLLREQPTHERSGDSSVRCCHRRGHRAR